MGKLAAFLPSMMLLVARSQLHAAHHLYYGAGIAAKPAAASSFRFSAALHATASVTPELHS